MSKNKKMLVRIICGVILFAAGFICERLPNETAALWASFSLFTLAVLVSGIDVIVGAFRNIFHGEVFDENFLMTVAAIGAFCIGEYPEAAAVMLFYQVGELFQSYAVGKSRKSISALMDIRPDCANVLRENETVTLDPYDVEIGDILIIKPGEKVPLDAVITKGHTFLETSALTGEAVPAEVSEGDEILSGSINQSGLIEARVTKEFGQSTVSKILELVESAADNKSKSENFITKFARYYTPSVVIAALLLAVIPPLAIPGASFRPWIYRALTFLVISCPCALVISIPLSFFAGIGSASKNGILVKGSNYLEDLSKAEIAVFDKTGTLTEGIFAVSSIHPADTTQDELLRIAASIEAYSNHPISMSIKEKYGNTININSISEVEEIAGHGVTARVDGMLCAAGNKKLMQMFGIEAADTDEAGTVVHVKYGDKYIGYIVISDKIRNDSQKSIVELKRSGIKKTVMLTGDNEKIAQAVGQKLGIDEIYSQLLPTDKVKKVQDLLSQKSKNGKLFFVGDGINDAPVLALSDLGIAMGGIGSDAAIEAADIVIMSDEPSKISTAMKISRKTLRIVKENIIFALGVKLIVLILGAIGFAPMWAAVFADVGVAAIAIMNAIRALRIKN